MKITGWLLTSVWLLIGFNTPALASVQVTGEFTATETCQVYQSIRRKTNPGAVQLEIGNSYQIIELNVSPGTTWYRIRIDGADPAERWTYFECGTATITSQPHSSSADRDHGTTDECKTAGQGDSYVFAVSWQPAFCEQHPNKPECSVTDPTPTRQKTFLCMACGPTKIRAASSTDSVENTKRTSAPSVISLPYL
jgi:ribonuclease T2